MGGRQRSLEHIGHLAPQELILFMKTGVNLMYPTNKEFFSPSWVHGLSSWLQMGPWMASDTLLGRPPANHICTARMCKKWYSVTSIKLFLKTFANVLHHMLRRCSRCSCVMPPTAQRSTCIACFEKLCGDDELACPRIHICCHILLCV